MQVAHANSRLFQIRRKLFRHTLGKRRNDHTLLLLHATLNALEEIVDLTLCWKDRDMWVNNAGRPNHLLHHLIRTLSLIASRRCGNIDRLTNTRLKLFKRQWAIVERAREAEAEVDEDLFPRAVVLVHANNLRNAHVALIDHEKPIGWEVVEQRPWPGARLAAREVTRVVLDPGAEPNLAHHLEVEGGALAQAGSFKDFPRRLQFTATTLHLDLNVSNGFLQLVRRCHIVGGWIDGHLVALCQDLAGERVYLCDALHLITEELHAQDRLFAGGLHLERVTTHTELGTTEGGVVALVLQVDEVAQDRIAAILPRLAHLEHCRAVVDRSTEAIDAGDRRHNDRVAPLKKRLGGRVSQLINLIIAAGVFLDVCVGAREVGLWLVVIEVRDKVFDGVLGEELLQLGIELRGERLVVRKDECWPLRLLDDVGDGEGLPRSRRSQEDLVMQTIPETFDEFRNRGWLVTGGDEVGAQGEGSPRRGGQFRRGFSRWIHLASIGGAAPGSRRARSEAAAHSHQSALRRSPPSPRGSRPARRSASGSPPRCRHGLRSAGGEPPRQHGGRAHRRALRRGRNVRAQSPQRSRAVPRAPRHLGSPH